MNIRILKINKIKMFWFIILIILGLGYFYFYKYRPPVNEGLEVINQIQNQLRRETMQKIENIQKSTDSFINKAQNEAIKPFL